MVLPPCILVLSSLGIFQGAAQSPDFTITSNPPSGSNIVQILPASSYLEVLAGVSYSSTIVTSSVSFFGTSTNSVNAKLIFSSNSVCTDSTSSLFGSPFDGLTRPSQLTQLSARFSAFKFDYGNNFTVCMNVSSSYTALPVTIASRGVSSTSLKIFCLFASSVDCSARLPGNMLSTNFDAKIGLVNYGSGTCGTSALLRGFDQTVSTATTSERSMEIHSFGSLLAGSTISSYKSCYCPSYQATGGSSGIVCSELASNFVQGIGTLILISSTFIDPITNLPTGVYPRIPFDLHIQCGTGGCSDSPRMKIIDANTINKRSYHDSSAGCRASVQSKRYLHPLNCDKTATDCSLSPDSSSTSSLIVFKGLQLDADITNGVRMTQSFDICFCDSECALQSNWLYIGSVDVLPLTVSFTQLGVEVSRLTANMPGSIRISGTQDGAVRISGTQSRELKLLNGYSVGSSDCFEVGQSPTNIVEHECYSVTNCDSPIESSRKSQVYGNDLIQIKQAGWTSVCYCNAGCAASNINWVAVGRLLVSGPKGDQSWTVKAGSLFALSIDGFGLDQSDQLSFVPKGNDCSMNEEKIFVNSPGSVLSGSMLAQVLDGFEAILGGDGTLLDFTSANGLKSGDRIKLSRIVTGNNNVERMLNNDLEVVVISGTRVRVNVQFEPGEFPGSIDLTSSSWKRTSRIDFSEIVLNQAGDYTVCWTGGTSSAPVGGIVVSEDP
jgi:hypothetical protein